jgi:formylglycine-generating enzyme required for sulfatase activity
MIPASQKMMEFAVVAVAGAVVWGASQYWGAPAFEGAPQMVAVQTAKPLYVQAREVTVAEWNRCHADKVCAQHLALPVGIVDTEYPATGISYTDAMQYVAWISARTGQDYRLPTRAEWLAIAAEVMPEKPDPIFTDPALTWASAYLLEAGVSRKLQPSGTFSTTLTGISDLDGNVWEWTQECYAGADGTLARDRCPAFYVMGEHEAVIPFLVQDPARGGCAVGAPPAHLGMRLVTDQQPRS